MAVEQARNITRSTRRGSYHADASRLTLPSEPPASREEPTSSRSEAVTRVCDETTAPPPSHREPTRDWCVDASTVILTLTTFELWEALESGQVQAWMRVWREGMECWTPVGEITEFAWALAQTPRPAPEAARISSVELQAELAHTTPPPRPSEIPAPPESGVRWVALGSLVAATAVASALLFAQRPMSAPSLEAARSAPAVAAPAASPEATPAPVRHARVTHADRGQERLPRGGRATAR